MSIHDFRSDTVTLPTPAMMAAVACARLGDSARGDDPTVNELEAVGRRLTGKADALFLPSGTMANLAAVIAHEVRGGEVIVEESAHLYNAEGGGLSVVAGAVARPVRGRDGVLDPAAVGMAIRDARNPAIAPTRLICVENTHNAAGGTVTPLADLAALHALASRHGLPIHLDGARLFNAATFLRVPILDICAHVDSVWFALCKGLGAPVGALLAGDAPFMARARRAAKMLGGGMRQAGLVAAPALVALADPYPGHARDHALARRLAVGVAALADGLVDVARVETNIVNCHFDRHTDDVTPIVEALRARAVLALGKRARIRFVTHRDVGEDAVAAAVAALAEVLNTLPRRRSLIGERS